MDKQDLKSTLHEFELKYSDAIYITLSLIENTMKKNDGCDPDKVLSSLRRFVENKKKKLQWYVDITTIHLESKIKDL